MSEETGTPETEAETDNARRQFIARVGEITIYAPAATMLLAASTRSGQAVAASVIIPRAKPQP